MLAGCALLAHSSNCDMPFGTAAYSCYAYTPSLTSQSRATPVSEGVSPCLSLILSHARILREGIGLVGSLINLLWVEPLATSIMFERYALENAPGGRDEGEAGGT